MPTQRTYASHAERQAAYRARGARATAELLAAKGLPPTSSIPSIPSYRRWGAVAQRARAMLQTMQDEMQTYHDERSDEWLDSERAEAFEEQLDALEAAADAIDELLGTFTSANSQTASADHRGTPALSQRRSGPTTPKTSQS